MLLLTAVRRLIAAETARYLCPNSVKANEAYAVAWQAAVAVRGGDSRGLARVSHYGALATIRRLAIGLSRNAAANDTTLVEVSL